MKHLQYCYFAILGVYIGLTSTDAIAEGVRWRDQFDLEQGAYHGHCEITLLGPNRLRTGDTIRLDIKFTGSGVFFYNPFFKTLIPPSAGIVAFDENKQYRGNLLASSFGSSRRPGPADWITLSSLCYLGRIMSLPLPIGSDPKKGLTPGKYYLQVIYHRRFISSPPVDERVGRITAESLKNWYDKFPETDLFRSNIVEIEIVDE